MEWKRMELLRMESLKRIEWKWNHRIELNGIESNHINQMNRIE